MGFGRQRREGGAVWQFGADFEGEPANARAGRRRQIAGIGEADGDGQVTWLAREQLQRSC